MTIVQVYHTMNRGGVGSYLLSLCSELTLRGHRVILAAPEGELTPLFRGAGIECRHVRIADWRLPKAGRELAGIIRGEAIDIVNAHDYSAGATAFLAVRATGTPYLLTIHCHRPWWQRFVVFYWSAHVLAMTPSLANGLIRRLGLPPDRIIETFVGVDVDRFAPGQPSASLAAEFGVSAASPVVLLVSRLSSTKGPVAVALVRAAAILAERVPALVVLIAGSGEHEAHVRAVANELNGRAKRPVVRVLGGRSDVPDLMRMATVVVGTGTVAIEAMSSGCPVVAAGKAGFAGLVTPEYFPAARACWFGDHAASALVSPSALAGALEPVLLDANRRSELGEWGRHVACDEYSTSRMTDQIERIYDGHRR